jgi:tripeptide aminopeptidase
VTRFGPAAIYLVVEGGSFGQVSYQAIGVRRYRIEVKAPGGHSWAHFGRPSAVHVLGRLIAALDNIRTPAQPKTTYNMGVIEGGLSVNAIAQSASLLLDLRSESPAALEELASQVTDIVATADQQADVSVTMTLIGNRPAGQIAPDTPLIQWAEAALRQVGWDQVEFMAGSTDANVPLSYGFPAVCIGLTKSGNTHRLDEYLDPAWLPTGLGQLLLLALTAAGFAE